MGSVKKSTRAAQGEKGDQNGVAVGRRLDGERRPEEEEELDRRHREEFRCGPEELGAKIWAESREFHRLRLLYPGKHVVFRDRWVGRGNNLRLVEVMPLLVTDDAEEARRFITELDKVTPRHERGWLGLTYVEPPVVCTPVRRKLRKSKRKP